MHRNLILYLLTIAIFGSLVWFVLDQGAKLENKQNAPTVVGDLQPEAGAGDHLFDASAQEGSLIIFLRDLSQNTAQPLSRLLLQIVVIIVTARFLAFLLAKLGQPLVMVEIIAGIILGPSVLGLLSPGISDFLFQSESLPDLQFLSQLGLILFMFIIGLELDLAQLRYTAHTAAVISQASIIFPFLGGVSLAYFLYGSLAPPQIPFLAFGLFMGIGMSITAFPVLARIINERGLAQSPLGILAITCAAAGDLTAWCILAAVIAIVKAGTVTNALFTVLLSVVYVFVMLAVLRPLLQRLAAHSATAENLNRAFIVIAFAILFLSALATEVIGIHALFGAFLAGVVIPAQRDFRKMLAAKIEAVSLVILLPLFFAFTGQSWSDSLAIGALMNTRGLMELIVLNIGYDLRVLSPMVFTMMVLMALVTTFMTSPALSAIQHFRLKRERLGVYPVPERT